MNKQLLEENKTKLLSEQKRLRAILEKSGRFEGSGEFPGEYRPEFPEFGKNEDENASEVTQYETNLAVTQDLEQKLLKVEAALQRIDDGTYGKCVQGDDIDEQRLRAIPEADTCVKHAGGSGWWSWFRRR